MKVPLFCVKQRLCKHCFENKWTLFEIQSKYAFSVIKKELGQ